MNGARDQLLAGAVLAENQHAAVGRRRQRDLLAQVLHRRALAHHRVLLLAIDLGAQHAVLGLEIALAQRVAHDQHGLLERQRLLDEVEGAHLDRAHRRLDVAVAGDDHDLRVDLPLAQPLQRRQAVEAAAARCRARSRRRRRRWPSRGTPRRCRRCRRRSLRRCSTPLTDERTPGSSSTTRMDGHQAGNSMIKRVPVGTLSVTSMLPPCSATMRRTIARPRPLPRPFVE